MIGLGIFTLATGILCLAHSMVYDSPGDYGGVVLGLANIGVGAGLLVTA